MNNNKNNNRDDDGRPHHHRRYHPKNPPPQVVNETATSSTDTNTFAPSSGGGNNNGRYYNYSNRSNEADTTPLDKHNVSQNSQSQNHLVGMASEEATTATTNGGGGASNHDLYRLQQQGRHNTRQHNEEEDDSRSTSLRDTKKNKKTKNSPHGGKYYSSTNVVGNGSNISHNNIENVTTATTTTMRPPSHPNNRYNSYVQGGGFGGWIQESDGQLTPINYSGRSTTSTPPPTPPPPPLVTRLPGWGCGRAETPTRNITRPGKPYRQSLMYLPVEQNTTLNGGNNNTLMTTTRIRTPSPYYYYQQQFVGKYFAHDDDGSLTAIIPGVILLDNTIPQPPPSPIPLPFDLRSGNSSSIFSDEMSTTIGSESLLTQRTQQRSPACSPSNASSSTTTSTSRRSTTTNASRRSHTLPIYSVQSARSYDWYYGKRLYPDPGKDLPDSIDGSISQLLPPLNQQVVEPSPALRRPTPEDENESSITIGQNSSKILPPRRQNNISFDKEAPLSSSSSNIAPPRRPNSTVGIQEVPSSSSMFHRRPNNTFDQEEPSSSSMATHDQEVPSSSMPTRPNTVDREEPSSMPLRPNRVGQEGPSRISLQPSPSHTERPCMTQPPGPYHGSGDVEAPTSSTPDDEPSEPLSSEGSSSDDSDSHCNSSALGSMNYTPRSWTDRVDDATRYTNTTGGSRSDTGMPIPLSDYVQNPHVNAVVPSSSHQQLAAVEEHDDFWSSPRGKKIIYSGSLVIVLGIMIEVIILLIKML